MLNFTAAGFAEFVLTNLVRGLPVATEQLLEQAGQIVEAKAKSVLGTYEFDWVPLAASTIARKRTGDSPGLETGEMRDSVTHYVTAGAFGNGQVNVGSDLDKALWFEYGTSRQPPRPWLTRACIEMEPIVVRMAGATVTAFLATGKVPPKAPWAIAAE